MDYQEINSFPKPSNKYKISTIFLIILFLFSVVAITFLSLEVIRLKNHINNNNNDKLIHPYDPTDDFPLNPHGPFNLSHHHNISHEYTFDEGTWINLDISPDGKHIIFDLLGDLYTLNYPNGGDAEIFRKGVSFDIQPSFSPNGKRLIFTSDQDGCDNIWVRDLENGDEWQVTFEPYHFISNGKWINNDKIIAVKWYTTTGSLPAGELWEYQIPLKNSKSNPGKRILGRSGYLYRVGPEEPFVNGEWVYYSKNIRDTTSFTYGKDPYKGIYSIFRLNLKTGKEEFIAGGPGGASRPVISNDGKRIAFIRRYYLRSSVILKDIDNGNEFILYDNLDIDQQESSAPSGTYPIFTFTPDDENIVLYSKGKIISINIKTVDIKQVPFRVLSSLMISETVRFDQNISDRDNPHSFKTKLSLTPFSSDNNDIISFNSIGLTFIYDNNKNIYDKIEDDNNSNFYFTPSISYDGKYLIHVVWDDHNLGIIQIVSLNDKSKRFNLPLPKGRYSYPMFSKDMKMIVYTRLPGDDLSGYQYGNGEGVYIINVYFDNNDDDIKFGDPKFIDNGKRGSFSKDSKTLFIEKGHYPLIVDEYNIEKLSKIKTIAECLYCTDISISPDKKYVAFIEFRNLYLQPFEIISSERGMNVSSRGKVSKNSPKTQVLSVTGSHRPTWSSDSKFIRWGWGSSFYIANIDFLNGCNHSNCLKDNINHFSLSVNLNTSVPNDVKYYLFNSTIITMNDNNDIINDGAIIVHNDRIIDIGHIDDIDKPDDSIDIDLNGGYILPGFIDAHAHWEGAEKADFSVRASWEFYANLAYGVTSLHNPSAETLSVFRESELVKSGRMIGPRVFSTGEPLFGAGGIYHCDISTVEEAINYLKALKDVGAWSSKSYHLPCRQQRLKVLEAARELKMNIVPEGAMAFYWNMNEIIDGHTTIEHSIPMAPLYNDVKTLFSKSGTAWTPTLIVNFGGVFGEEYWFQHEKVWLDERLNRFIPQYVLMPRSIRRIAMEDDDYHHFRTSRVVKEINDMGGLVNIGAHGQMQGIGFHWEMGMFEQGGMDVINIIRSATANPAKSLGIFNEIGSLEVGKLADMIIYDKNDDLLKSVINLRDIKYVMIDGRIRDAKTLKQIYPYEEDAPKLPILNTPKLEDDIHIYNFTKIDI